MSLIVVCTEPAAIDAIPDVPVVGLLKLIENDFVPPAIFRSAAWTMNGSKLYPELNFSRPELVSKVMPPFVATLAARIAW